MPTTEFQDTVTCSICGGQASRKIIRTGVKGAKPVAVIDCPACDRSRCKPCGENVIDRHARTCPKGHRLPYTADGAR
jgi:hypothetical protein